MSTAKHTQSFNGDRLDDAVDAIDDLNDDDGDLDGPIEVQAGNQAAFEDPRAVTVRWQVPHEFAGTRADVYLSIKVGRMSRLRCQRVISRGDFRRPCRPLKPSSKMKALEEVILWRIPPDFPQDLTCSPKIIFEDDDVLVVNKPSDLAVHPTARYLFRTLTHWLSQLVPAGARPASPCHRLDRETSGLLICAKSKAMDVHIKRAFQAGSVRKIYLAIVRGNLSQPQTISAPLAQQGDRGLVRIRMVVDPNGQEACTHVVPLCLSQGKSPSQETSVDGHETRTLVACFPVTGRQHQIRVHLAHIGFPLVGDKLYAMGDVYFDRFTQEGTSSGDGLDHPRHALHAYALEVPLPKGTQRFLCPLPPDLLSLLPGIDAETIAEKIAQTTAAPS